MESSYFRAAAREIPARTLEEVFVVSDALEIIAENLAGAHAPCVTSSFQAPGVVLLHMLRQFRPDIPVLFVDTLHHFPETLDYRNELARRWRLNVITLSAPQPSVGLWEQDTDSCCARHKVAPLFAELPRYDLWFTAIGRDQAPTRANVGVVERFRLPNGQTIRKVNALAEWTTQQVHAYAKEHSIPLLPLYDVGYTSIGCEPCTTLPIHISSPRSGRWGGRKLECGIHVQARVEQGTT
jgi:phosphoadenosine phosphosulfate reductase